MSREIKKLSFKEKVDAFLNQLEIARLQEGNIRDGIFQGVVDDFCSRVSRAVKRACAKGVPIDEKTVRGKMEIKLPGDEVWSASNTLFDVVELVECRLFGANWLFGISLNTITSHFQHECDESNMFKFSWTIMIRDIKDPTTYPTVKSVLADIRREKMKKEQMRDSP